METPTFNRPDALPTPRRRFGWLGALTLALFVFSLLSAVAMTRLGTLHGNDFKHLWLGSWLLAEGQNPYDAELLLRAAQSKRMESVNPFVYLPTTGLMLWPLAKMENWPSALLVWFWINWALAWGVALAGPWALKVARPGMARLAGAAFLAGSLTFFRQQTAGQMNVITAALIVWAAAGLIRKKDWWTGVALALGWGWKIAPGLLVAALAPLRRWRALAWAGVGCGALLALSVMIYGVEVHRAALPVLRQMGYGKSTWAEFGEDFYRQPFNQSPNAFFHHILTENPYTRPWVSGTAGLANGVTAAFSLALAGLWLWAAWRNYCGLRIADCGLSNVQCPMSNAEEANPHAEKHENHRQSAIRNPQSSIHTAPHFLAASLAMLLLPSLMWDHYAVQALPVIIWIFGQRATLHTPWRAGLALACLAALTIPVQHGAWNQGVGIVVMSLRLWPILVMYCWMILDRSLAIRE